MSACSTAACLGVEAPTDAGVCAWLSNPVAMQTQITTKNFVEYRTITIPVNGLKQHHCTVRDRYAEVPADGVP
jgi:hypothetical protein